MGCKSRFSTVNTKSNASTTHLRATTVTISKPQNLPCRQFHTTYRNLNGIQPDTEDPEPPITQADVAGGAAHVAEPADISTEEYHEIADQYIDTILARLEAMAEDLEKGLEVEYSVSTSGRSNGTDDGLSRYNIRCALARIILLLN